MHRYLTIFLIIGLSSAGNLFINSDFEQPLTTAWQQLTAGLNITINRATDYDPDPDYEAFAYKGTGSGYIKLFQVVEIQTMPLTELEFSVNTKLYAYDNDADTLCWAAAGIVISYLDESNSLLGDTRICLFTTPCPWQNTLTCHLIIAPDTFWHNYSFNINDELGNLPGVNPAAIKKIAIALYDTTAHTC